MNAMPVPGEVALPPALIVVHAGGAKAARRPPDTTLLAALPAAHRVLEVRSDLLEIVTNAEDDSLSGAYRARHPKAAWQRATPTDLARLDAPFDLIVLPHGFIGFADPLALLNELAAHAGTDTTLFLAIDNAACLEALERVVEADLSELAAGGRADSPASVFKLLMDAGWMPCLAAQRPSAASNDTLSDAALAMADALGIPRGTAQRMLHMERLVISATRVFTDAVDASGDAPACFSVVVPTTRERQLRLNVERSPGLHEVAARIVSYRGARSPAEALEQSAAHADTDWVLLCHQDVYFPTGFGRRLNALLASVPAAERDRTLIGFVGMAVNTTAQRCEPSGFVIDRLHAADHPASDQAVSIDELAIVMSRQSIHRIDPALGWHLWATDLCLTAICRHQVFPRIVRLPLFHNSVTDYQLPTAFFDAAAVLAQKHESFGPIPTLCGTIDAAWLAAHGRPMRAAAPVAEAATASVGSRLDLVVQPATRDIDALIDAGDFDAATEAIHRSVHSTYTQDGIKHRALYTPEFDRQVMRLAQALGSDPSTQRSGVPGVPLLIATELYDLGGHSRVLEEVSREMKQPVLVLTDLFRTYHRNPAELERVRQRFAHTQVIVLPDIPSWEKCRMLRLLDQHLMPRSTWYFGHHQDPIPFIGTLAQPGLRRLFVHHGDHNPSLGCTLPNVQHVDLIGNLQTLCSEHLGTPAQRLPLHIADQGTKRFSAVHGCDYSVVTSGHPAKFSRNGAVALQDIVAAALSVVHGRFFHIGPLADDWVAEIRIHLAARGIDVARFVPLGLVPSVWETLKAIDAAVYIGSAPVSGGRAGIEAQGCGYPVLCFNGFADGSLLADYSSYADPSMGWSDPQQLAARLSALGDQHAALSRQARAFYEAEFSRTKFRAAMRELLGHH